MAFGFGYGMPHARPQLDGLTLAVKAMFASAEKGVMFDLSRAANLYTDSARTALVTASGDRIGSATDLSPNGKHASSAGTARPIWNSAGYGTFDALDDYLQTAAIDFSGTDKVTIVASVLKSSDAATTALLELSASSSATPGTFAIFAPLTAGQPQYVWRDQLTVAPGQSATATGFAAPATSVLTAQSAAGSASSLRVNGSAAATGSGAAAGSLTNNALNIGARNAASLFFNGRLYRLLIIGRALTTTERATAERWAAQPAGVVIP